MEVENVLDVEVQGVLPDIRNTNVPVVMEVEYALFVMEMGDGTIN